MMLEKISVIRDHKCFRDLRWGDLPTFSRFNLIYGWNGSGKTTLSNILAHLEQAQPITEGQVSFTISGQQVHGDAIAVSPLPLVRVFNRDYADTSVLNRSGNLEHIFFLGQTAVAKEKERAVAAVELKRVEGEWGKANGKRSNAMQDFERFKRDKAAAIKQLLRGPGKNRFANYDKSDFEAQCSLVSKGQRVAPVLDEETRDMLLKTSRADIRQRIESSRDVEPVDPAWIGELQHGFGSSPTVSAIEALTADPDLSSWLGTGLALHKARSSSVCLFCEQPIAASRVERLEAHFNDAYRNFAHFIVRLIHGVSAFHAQVSAIAPPDAGLTYPQLVDELRMANQSLSSAKDKLLRLLVALLEALKQKQERALEKADAPIELLQLVASTETLCSAMVEVKRIINEHNRITDNFQSELIAARDRLELDAVAQAIAEFDGRQDSVAEKSEELTKLSSQQNELKLRIEQLEKDITETIEPANQLNADLAVYLGHSELTLTHHGNGYAITRAGQPASDLSEGEKTGLALLYFLKSLEDHRWPLKDSIVVVDDPVSSLDAGALYTAFGFLKERTERAMQLFILTHDFAFFQLAKGWFRHARNDGGGKVPVSMYQLKACISNGVKQCMLVKLDRLLSEYDTEYQYLFQLVHQGAATDARNLEELYGLPNVARRLLEHFLAFRFPGDRSSEKLLERMKELAIDGSATAVINRFLNINSHGDGVAPAEHDLHLLAEAPRVLRAVLTVMRAEDPSHVKRMEAVIVGG